MNSRFKFRSWMDYSKEFIFFDTYSENMNNLILSQFTGLIDQTGKEIYEGDLFQVAGNKIYRVEYCVGKTSEDFEWYGGCFILQSIQNEELFFPFDEYAMKNGKVIGNVYENPESDE